MTLDLPGGGTVSSAQLGSDAAASGERTGLQKLLHGF